MTDQQIIALVVICAFIIGLFAYAYYLGLSKGTRRGRSQIENRIWSLASEKRLLEKNLQMLQQERNDLSAQANLNEGHHRTLLRIAENLRVAAETWSAFKTGKKLERDARTLRNEALAMAELLKPADLEAAA
ncbi:hypothetical protein [Pseudomonas sp. Irchel 3F5]|uniref:hypothetical protein n=1 Tax=Pseudomonas sp. Irchel 3F5 TaxID=2009002 RepID=UPI000BA498DE|nr:hypothetical protein [Pseudomonas sp. Irchel 3F5]